MRVCTMKKQNLELLIWYHRNFVGDTYEVCSICQGECEKYLVSCLLPGEIELISSYLNVSSQKFQNKYTDTIRTSNRDVTVLRLCTRCPFISNDFRCTIKDVKPIMCDIYPVYISVPKKNKLYFGLDPKCALTHYKPTADLFRKKCVPLLKQLKISPKIYAAIEEFDCESYDFDILDKQRKKNMQHIYSVEDVKKGIVDRSPGIFAKIWKNIISDSPDKSLNITSNNLELLNDLKLLLKVLQKTENDSTHWSKVEEYSTSLKEKIYYSDSVEYITAIMHLAKWKVKKQNNDIHKAVSLAALARIPYNNRRNLFYKWIKKHFFNQ